jgi:hypothetical protein
MGEIDVDRDRRLRGGSGGEQQKQSEAAKRHG